MTDLALELSLSILNLLSPNIKKSSSLYPSSFKAVLLKTGGPKQTLISSGNSLSFKGTSFTSVWNMVGAK